MSLIGLGVPVNTAAKYIPSKVYSASLQQGAALVADATNFGCKAPGAAAAPGFMGILGNQQTSSGTASGDAIDLQIEGVALCLLTAAATATFGGELVIGGTDGSLRPYVAATDDEASIVGIAQQTITAGASAQPFSVLLRPYTVHQAP